MPTVTHFSNFTALKQPQLMFENLFTFVYQKFGIFEQGCQCGCKMWNMDFNQPSRKGKSFRENALVSLLLFILGQSVLTMLTLAS